MAVQVRAAFPVDVLGLLVGPDLRVTGDADVVFWNSPRGEGVDWAPGVGAAQLTVDTARLPERVAAVLVVVALPEEAPGQFGGLAPPEVQLSGAEEGDRAAEAVQVLLDGLDRERAVVAVELYRRGGAWKVRAVGQGHAEGLAHLLHVHGVDIEASADPAPVPSAGRDGGHPSASPGGTSPGSQAPAGPGTTTAAAPAGTATTPGPALVDFADRVWLIWEDASRSASAYRSARDHAVRLRDDQLAGVAVTGDHEQIMHAAQQRLDEDLATLARELAETAGSVPAAMSEWDSPVWLTWQPEAQPLPGVLAGHVHMAEAPGLRIPLVLRRPWTRSVWVDPGPLPDDAAAFGWSLVTRYLAALPARSVAVDVIDMSGEGGLTWLHTLPAPVVEGVLAGGVSTGRGQVTARLGRLLDAIDLRAIGADEDAAARLGGRPLRLAVILAPAAAEEDGQLLHHLLRLVDEGPQHGVPTICVESELGEESLRGARLRMAAEHLPSGSGSSLGDPWVHGEWMFTPQVLPDVAAVRAGPRAAPPALLRHVLTLHQSAAPSR
jgi:stress response protein SCP2